MNRTNLSGGAGVHGGLGRPAGGGGTDRRGGSSGGGGGCTLGPCSSTSLEGQSKLRSESRWSLYMLCLLGCGAPWNLCSIGRMGDVTAERDCCFGYRSSELSLI